MNKSSDMFSHKYHLKSARRTGTQAKLAWVLVLPLLAISSAALALYGDGEAEIDYSAPDLIGSARTISTFLQPDEFWYNCDFAASECDMWYFKGTRVEAYLFGPPGLVGYFPAESPAAETQAPVSHQPAFSGWWWITGLHWLIYDYKRLTCLGLPPYGCNGEPLYEYEVYDMVDQSYAPIYVELP